MSLRDGQTKMSKTDPSDMSRVNLTDSDDLIAQKIRKAKTDPEPLPDNPAALEGRPEARNLVGIYGAITGESIEQVLARFSGQGFGTFKPALADVLVDDVMALVAHLGLADFDLVGFSLGARTAARAVLAGLKPRRLVLSGMGLEGLAGWAGRRDFFLDVIDRFDTIRHGDPAFQARSFLKTMGVDRTAARLLLGTMEDTEPEALGAITMPTLVLCGAEDDDNGSADRLAEALPDAVRVTIPGTHMSSVTRPELGAELVRFLAP